MRARYMHIGGAVALSVLFLVPGIVFADAAAAVAARQTELRAQLDELNRQIEAQQRILEQKHSESASLERAIDIINAYIQKDELSIKARELTIAALTDDINEKSKAIGALDDKFTREHESLADILRKTKTIDAYTITEVIFSSGTVSSLFEDLHSFAAIKEALKGSFVEIADTKAATAAARAELEEKRREEQELRRNQIIQRNRVNENKEQQELLLSGVKAEANQYQSIIQANKKIIAQIEAELFGLRDTAPIPFGQALVYANQASQRTGVRPALILGVLKQESDLGENIGSCYVVNLTTGDGIGKNSATPYQKVMKAPRDSIPFERITGSLGIPWATAPVSCPLSPRYTASRGYGGAMGPSQFIPSTWELYTSRLAAALGPGEPDPWNAKDAIMATAIYLADMGAAGGTYAAERNAACKYYSGRVCDNRRPANRFYGDSVMDNAAFYQNQIDILGSS